ncbi:solute carrier family 39 (zinc transporter), member 9 [Schistosoma bovis]|uniref:Solute carrier family 39 (Zinc transporter), member 9 n=1 Tax=Schistosoma bovis TaxID=6184 RepID=A0A430QG80_SCHBO|nr:solute carrier family 39 (zinc transporter), member 9 [Schistosoma bovis]
MLYLIFLNILLFIGCYIAGCIPISFKIPVSKIRILTIFGAGLLLGAALVVVIPEGIAVICSPHKDQHSNLISNKDNHLNHPNSRSLNMIDTIESRNEKHLPSVINKDNDQMKQQNNINNENNHASNEDHHSHNDNNNNSSSSYIHQKVGIALLLGYLFMLLVDQMSYTILELTCCQTILFGLKNLCYHSILYIPLMNRFYNKNNNNNNNNTSTVINNSMNTTNSTSNNTNNLSNETSINNNNNSSNCSSINSIQSINHKGLIVTCGLVIHSLADGLAIGSAFALNQLQLELILFLAIILHKIPAAFGLSCFLLHEGFTRDRIRLHMIAFSLSSPLASFLTYFYLSLSSTDTDINTASTRTGIALLLSGGTFLYVAATHILPELINSSNTSNIIELNTINDTTNINKQIRNPNLYLFNESLNNTPGHHALYTVDNSHESIIMYNYPKSNHDYMNPISHVHRLSIIEVIVLITGTIIPILFSANHSH